MNNDTFPLVVFPPALKIAVEWASQIRLPPPDLEQLEPAPKKPSRVKWFKLFVEAAGAVVAPKLVQMFLPVFKHYDNVATSVLLSAIALEAILSWRTYRDRITAYRLDEEEYQKRKNRYYSEKLAYYQQVENATDPLVLYLDLRQKLAPIIAAIQPPDGFSDDAPRGASEAEFKKHLERWFSQHIHEGAMVRKEESDRPCTADFSYIDKTNGLHVDIEVDEPYIYGTKTPIHYIGKDEWRNDLFNSRGWPVIRFCEEQIICHPDSCCKEIAQLVSMVTGEQELLPRFNNIPPLPRIKRWTEAEARQMAHQLYRDSYKNRSIRIPEKSKEKPNKPKP